MPVYLFTFHGRGTWMPDHARGYVHRQRGLQPSDPHLAAAYRSRQHEPEVRFTIEQQKLIVDTAAATGPFLDARVRVVTCDPTHGHVLLSWKHSKGWPAMRRSIRTALSRSLNAIFGKRDWFAENPSRKQVRDFEHFDYLVLAYLPRHRAAMWRDANTVERAEARDALRPVSVTKRRRRTRKRGESKPR